MRVLGTASTPSVGIVLTAQHTRNGGIVISRTRPMIDRVQVFYPTKYRAVNLNESLIKVLSESETAYSPAEKTSQ